MYKKTLTYTNYNGLAVTENLYFNLSSIEVARFARKYTDQENISLADVIQQIANSGNIFKMIEFTSDMVLSSYGRITDDGKMDKSESVVDNFATSVAYAEYVDILITDVEESKRFGAKVVSASQILDKMNAAPIAKPEPTIDIPSLQSDVHQALSQAAPIESNSDDLALLEEFKKFKAQQGK